MSSKVKILIGLDESWIWTDLDQVTPLVCRYGEVRTFGLCLNVCLVFISQDTNSKKQKEQLVFLSYLKDVQVFVPLMSSHLCV